MSIHSELATLQEFAKLPESNNHDNEHLKLMELCILSGFKFDEIKHKHKMMLVWIHSSLLLGLPLSIAKQKGEEAHAGWFIHFCEAVEKGLPPLIAFNQSSNWLVHCSFAIESGLIPINSEGKTEEWLESFTDCVSSGLTPEVATEKTLEQLNKIKEMLWEMEE